MQELEEAKQAENASLEQAVPTAKADATEACAAVVCADAPATTDATPEKDERIFTHDACPYFPCHQLPSDITFNCVFCYCPLYALGPDCGGAFRYNEKGYKDCTYCTVMHEGSRGFDRVQELFPKLAELARRTS